MSEFLRRYRRGRAWRTCPQCDGSGEQTNWQTLRSRTCDVCGGDRRARFTRWVSFRYAIGWWTKDLAHAVTHEPYFQNVEAIEGELLASAIPVAGLDWRVVAPILRSGRWRAIQDDRTMGSMFLREWLDAAEKAGR